MSHHYTEFSCNDLPEGGLEIITVIAPGHESHTANFLKETKALDPQKAKVTLELDVAKATARIVCRIVNQVGPKELDPAGPDDPGIDDPAGPDDPGVDEADALEAAGPEDPEPEDVPVKPRGKRKAKK